MCVCRCHWTSAVRCFHATHHPPLRCCFVSSGVSSPPFSHSFPPRNQKPGWQADGTDEDGRDWLIPNLLSPCHSGPQRRDGNKRKRRKERERVMEPARWSQLSDGESFMVLRTQQLHRARLHGSALLSIFLVGSRCRPSCVYPGFVLSCPPPPSHSPCSSTYTSYFSVLSFPPFPHRSWHWCGQKTLDWSFARCNVMHV